MKSVSTRSPSPPPALLQLLPLVLGLLSLISCLVPARAWLLETNMDEVLLGETQNVTLACKQASGDGQNSVVKPSRLRITKLDILGNKFTLAGIDDVTSGNVFHVGQDLTITSRTTGSDGFFLKVVWPVATRSTLGTFQCQISGFDKDNNFVGADTAPLAINQKVFTTHEIQRIIDQRLPSASNLEAVKQELRNETMHLKEYLGHQLNEIKRQVQDELIKVHINISDFKREMESRFVTAHELSQQISNLANDTLDRIASERKINKGIQDDIYKSIKTVSDKFFANQTSVLNAQTKLTNSIDHELQAIKANATRAGLEIESKLSALKKSIDTVAGTYANEIGQLSNKLDNMTQTCCSRSTSAPQTTPPPTTATPSSTPDQSLSSKWPRGNYGLVMSAAGCPDGLLTNGTKVFQEKSADSQTPSVGSDDNVPGSDYFTMSIQTDSKAESLKFCMKTVSEKLSSQAALPSGSYCLASYERHCPQSMKDEVLVIDVNENSKLHVFTLHLCCREDGLANAKIQLPNTKAFSLFRHGDSCQRVAGMDETPASLLVTPLNSSSKMHVVYNGYRGHANDSGKTLHVCHYQPSSSTK